MHRNVKLGLVGAVLLAGLLAASLFQHEPPLVAPPLQGGADLVLREDAGPRYLTETRPASAGTTLAMPPLPGPAATEQPTVNARDDAEPALVSLSPFEWVDPAPPAISWSDPTEGFDTWSAHLPAIGGDDTIDDAETDEADDRPRRHTIVDGDTLEALASRYLGDPARANELLEANRNVLADPDVLPIGQVLIVPAAAGDAPRHEPAEQEAVPARPLVPVAPSSGD